MVGKADSGALGDTSPAAVAVGPSAELGDGSAKAEKPSTWVARDREGVYRELEHPADLLLEINGLDLAALFENALFAFYDQAAELQGFAANREVSIAVQGTSPADALRALLSEALYRLETEGFVAVGAEVKIETDTSSGRVGTQTGETGPDTGGVQAVARLWGENTADRHTLATEIKAVTYHQLALERMADGTLRATVLFDV
jgi:SHS2 domain-containing protein